MNIELLEWIVKNAIGFEFVKKDLWMGKYTIVLLAPNKKKLIFPPEMNIEIDVYFPFLLQRAIEGINRKYNGQNWIAVESDRISCVFVWDEKDKDFFFRDYTDEDEAKVGALELFWKKECGDE